MRSKLMSSVYACVAIALVAPAGAQAATFNVNTTADSTVAGGCTTDPTCSLRDAAAAAVASADPDDTVNVPAGTYTLTLGEISLSGPVAVVGAGARTTTIDANGASRVFNIPSGTVSISGFTMTGGDSGVSSVAPFAGDGGAIVAGTSSSAGADVTVSDSTITGNNATFNGGGIAMPGFEMLPESSLTVTNSTIADNHVTGGAGEGLGGGIGTFGDLTVTNSTISGNSVANTGFVNMGGGIAVSVDPSDTNGTTATLVNATIAGNDVSGIGAGDMGGGLAIGAGTATVNATNTIVAGNTVDTAAGDCGGIMTITTVNNLSSDSSCQFTDAGSLQNTDPQLGALANNTGPTDTRKPAQGSPASNAGSPAGCPATDQRGISRPQGSACDIGAVELAPPVVTTDPASDVTSTSATLHGSAGNPSFTNGTVVFEYGTTTAYGSTTTASALAAGASASPSAGLTGLAPGTTYHYRAVGTNDEGTSAGGDQTFDTPAVRVTVTSRLRPSSAPGRFDLRVNGTPVATGAGDGAQGGTGPLAIGTDVTVSEVAASGTKLSNYDTKIDCGSAGSGNGTSLTLKALAADASCTITNTRRGTAPILKISHRKVTTNSSGALIRLRCVGKSGSCKGTLKLQATGRRSRLGAARAKPKPVSFSVPAGKTKGYRTPLPSRTRTQLVRRGKAVARAIATRSNGKVVKRLVTVFPG